MRWEPQIVEKYFVGQLVKMGWRCAQGDYEEGAYAGVPKLELP